MWHLLFRGHLPDRAERDAFRRQVAGYRALPADLVPFLRTLAATDPFDPLAALRTAISFVAQRSGFRSWLDVPPDQLYDNAMQLSAQTPVLIAALYRLHRGLEPVAADPALPAAANYLYLLSGEHPDPQRVWALERYLISTIDHGFNPSTFTARVITSTGADLGAAVTGAIGALSGPLHGGAPSRVLDMLDDIGSPDRAEAWVRDAVRRGDLIMGFGHRAYKGKDPRSALLRDVANALGGPTAEFAIAVEDTIVRGPGRGEARARAQLQRRVLRQRGHGCLRDSAGAVHAHLRLQPGHRLVRARGGAGVRQPGHPSRGPLRRPARRCRFPAATREPGRPAEQPRPPSSGPRRARGSALARASAAELLAAAAGLAQAAALGRVEHRVGDGRDGDRQHDDPEGHPPGREDQQDEPDDDTGDAVLHVGRHTGLPLLGGFVLLARCVLTS